ncbi:glycosyl transferase [Kaistia sp. 32K]|uniref:glycosyltransferase family 2 protein n=1 Tax=Kaistia sp. 32K TaxID=2795690 RepID=UPI0019164B5E|nr:glycosyltransferase family A protein [Kaistia sp. 32K]BCP52437.1 glycosyl transferase [Kaistia sp. 32K]
MTDPWTDAGDDVAISDAKLAVGDPWAALGEKVRREAPSGWSEKLRVAVVIATHGRPDALAGVVERLDRQTVKPDSIWISCASIADAGALVHRPDINVIVAPAGLPRQRNAALRQIGPDTGIVVFFDDDFVPHPRWIEMTELRFRVNPDVVAVTGHVIADGIKGPGLTLEEADTLLASLDGRGIDWLHENYSPYGCNMAFRYSAIADLYFDERLVLYGWLEDRDFGGALAKRGGRMLKLGAACGVHLGIKQGRVSGRRLGYSQIVNPIYLHRKGTMTLGSLMRHIAGNFGSNLIGTFVPEPYIDRFGRLRGNLLGFANVLVGNVRPERAERL